MLSEKKRETIWPSTCNEKLSLMLKYQKVYTKMLLTIFLNCQLWGDGQGCEVGGASMKVWMVNRRKGQKKPRPHFKWFWKEMVC